MMYLCSSTTYQSTSNPQLAVTRSGTVNVWRGSTIPRVGLNARFAIPVHDQPDFAKINTVPYIKHIFICFKFMNNDTFLQMKCVLTCFSFERFIIKYSNTCCFTSSSCCCWNCKKIKWSDDAFTWWHTGYELYSNHNMLFTYQNINLKQNILNDRFC